MVGDQGLGRIICRGGRKISGRKLAEGEESLCMSVGDGEGRRQGGRIYEFNELKEEEKEILGVYLIYH